MMRKLGLQSLVLLLGLGLFIVSVHAQSTTVGSISGTVRDPQGAVIPKAEVTITEETTGVERTVVAGDDGFYSVPSLPVGLYTVSAAPQGFKKTVNSGVQLHVGDKLVVNLNVEVGAVSETVNITGEGVQVETRSADVSSLIGEKQVTELPLNGRNYAALATMVPGVSFANEAGAFGTRGTGLDSHVDMSVNGNQSNANMWTVDGVNNMDVGSNATLLVFPSIDSIAEFRVERNSFSAEYGQAQGAVINLVTKGGGNDFHGTLFEFVRNDVLNANDFFLNQVTSPENLDRNGKSRRPTLRYNNFGGNFSGPIVKKRAFFWWSEEWRREQRGTILPSSTVPTAQERIGDFSGPIHTGPIPVDPLTGLPFPGNRIPANRLSPAGLALMNIFPLPNSGGGTAWVGAPTQPVNTRQDLIRGDVNITSKMSLMVRYINEKFVHGDAAGNFWGDSPFPTLSSDWDQPSRSFAVKLTNTLSSTAVNEFQFSRAGNDILVNTSAGSEALNQEIASKFPTVFPRPEGGGIPTVGWGGGGIPTLWHQAPWQNHEDLFIWKDDFSKVIGNHDLKVGGLVSHNIKNEQPNGNSGLYTIQNTGARTNNYFAELLVKDLPLVEYSEFQRQNTTAGRWHDFEMYANDTWKFSQRVTLTLGLRYSLFPPAYSGDNEISNWLPNLYDGHNVNSGFVQPGNGNLPRALVNTYKMGFQPRVGFAWDVNGDGKMAVRIGAGRYIARSNVIASLLRMASNPPWNTSVDTGWQSGAISLADCPTCRSLDTINPGLKNSAAGLGTVYSVDPNFKPPESWQWNLTVSREVMKNTVVEASYIGNHGLHIWRLINGNYNDTLPQFRATIVHDFGLNPTADQVAKYRRFVGVPNVTRDESTGDSNYHALQVWVNRRFSNRLAFQAAYTWSHSISNVPTQSYISATTDVFDYNLDRGNSDLDRRHMFVFNATYSLPTFQKWGSVASAVLGDWQFNTITSFLSGTPLNILSGVNTTGQTSATTQRPNLISGVPIYLNNPGDPAQIINPAAFAVPAAGQFGSLGRNSIVGPGIKNVDFSLAKNWKVAERYGLQFRAEMFNAFNFVNFRSGNATQAAGLINNQLGTNFGRATSTRGPREIQFGLKFNF
jgi:hypothetical protein